MGQGLEGNAPQWAPLNVEEGQAPTLTTPTVWRRRQREKEEQERRSSRREGAASTYDISSAILRCPSSIHSPAGETPTLVDKLSRYGRHQTRSFMTETQP